MIIGLSICFSCSLNLGKTGAIPLDTAEIVRLVREATDVTNEQIKIVAKITGNKGYNKTQTLDNIGSEQELHKKTILFDQITIGETVTINVEVFVDNVKKYIATNSVVVEKGEKKCLWYCNLLKTILIK